ncbi:MAG: DNA alkylation repair protein [Lachnospiraceae bacterium]|nr:DNA alkylation repair protein [Lachnospiraceae bacterium]
MTILERLFALQDKEYAVFQSKLTPGIEPELFIGVRVPEARKLAKALKNDSETDSFIRSLPHTYYDENMLHGLILSEIKEYDSCIQAVDAFLPYVDNWAVCDIMSPKVFRKHKAELIHKIREWSASEATYTCRFGMEMLMTHYLDEEFDPAYLDIPADVHSDEYYVKMMQAWFFATALAKQWDAVIPYIQEQRLDQWVHNKTIQKARESYRITPEQKEYLKGLKIKKP